MRTRLHKSVCLWHVLIITNLMILMVDASFLLDLTHTLSEDLPHWTKEEKFRINTLFNGIQENGGYWFKLESMSTGTHMGTHMDAPCHFSKDGWCISDIPIQRLITPLVVVDIRERVGDNSDTYLTPDDLRNWEYRHGLIPNGSVVMVLTGWSRYWNDVSKYWGTEVWNMSNLHFPGVGEDAARWLTENRDIYGLGVDTISVDYGRALQPPIVHQITAARNIYNLENVVNLERVPATGATLVAAPMKIKGASGAPVRLIALLEPDLTPTCGP